MTANDIVNRLSSILNNEDEPTALKDLLDARHQLTAIISQNLCGRGVEEEGRHAYDVRKTLDNFFFSEEAENPQKGDKELIPTLRRAIILQSYAEIIEILEDYSKRFGYTAKGIKQGMGAILSDPYLIGRYADREQAMIKDVYNSWRFSTVKKYEELYYGLRRGVAQYLSPQ